MLPQGLIQSLKHLVGFDENAFKAVHNNDEILTSIRKNAFKNAPLSFENTTPIDWCTQGLYLEKRPSFVFDPLWHAGAYYVQEASSMFLWHICHCLFGENTKQLVLDLCAAPGGKSTLLSDYFYDGLIISNEVIKPRAAILEENITKWGNGNVVITCNDAEYFKPLGNLFDAVFVDAPCSGSGLFRKDKDAIQEWSENNVELCSQRQKRIIGNIITTLKLDGYLIYSTCSYSQQENEDVVDWIMDNFEVENIAIPLDENWGIVASSSFKHQAMGYRFYPYLTKGEGFFVSVFKKKNGSKNSTFKLLKNKKIISATKNETTISSLYLQSPNNYNFIKHNEDVIAISKFWEQTFEWLAQHLYIKKIGTIIGQIKHNEVVPAHDIAMSTKKAKSIVTIEVDKEAAIKYLQKKDIQLAFNVKGWVLLSYCEVSIGFVKVLPNRINNYYPKEWRILKDYF